MSDQAALLRRLSTLDSAHVTPGISVQTGRVSFAPQRPRTLPVEPPLRLASAIAITSGKGGVGKTSIAVNLAYHLARMGRRVCLFDADLGLANADVMCGISPRITLEDVICRGRRLSETVILGPGGFRLIPGGSGVARLADLSTRQRADLLGKLSGLERVADIILIDTGAGLGSNVLSFAGTAAKTLIVTTPEPTALTDAYAMIKTLSLQAPEVQLEIIVNQVSDRAEGEGVFLRINKVCGTFLRRQVGLAGWIPADSSMGRAVRRRQPISVIEPGNVCARRIQSIASTLLGEDSAKSQETGGFFSRVSRWFSGGKQG